MNRKLGTDELEIYINADLNDAAKYELDNFLVKFKKKYNLFIWLKILNEDGTTNLKVINSF